MNYIGSKYSLLEFLEEGITKHVDSASNTLFDVFAGTGVVGKHFKQKGFRVISNDIQYYSYCLNKALIEINIEPEFLKLSEEVKVPQNTLFYDAIDVVLEHLNALEGCEGFIYRNYCAGGTREADILRQYFSDENGQRCDAIRVQIEQWWADGKLTENEYFYLLASLIDAVDRVANTASVYGAFLKHIKKSAMKPLLLERVPVVKSKKEHKVYHCNGSTLVAQVSCDILYMDPPYNHRQYCTNYHMLETLARYDQPEIYGVTGLRPYSDQKSEFCMRKRALSAFETMVEKTQARYVFLSYSSEGIMSKDDILSVMDRYGKVALETRDYSRFRADIDRENRVYKANRVEEYLFCLEKGL